MHIPKWFFALLLLLIILGFGTFFFFQEKTISNELVLYGNVDVRQLDLGFRVSGRVSQLFFEEGDFVSAGDLVALLEKNPYDAQMRQAEANAASVKANLENAQILLDRRLQLIGIGGVSQEEVDNALASRNELFASFIAAESAARVAKDQLNYTELYAPTDGVILSRVREPGTALNPTDPVYTLSIISPVWVRAYVSEPDLGLICYGMKARISTDSEQIYEGKIGFISPTAEFTPKTVETTVLRTDLVYRLRIYADNPDCYLKQGMPVTVTIDVARP